MDFKPAIRQHVEWRFRLFNMVNGKSKEDLSVQQVSVDNRCILGQWIYGEGIEKYSNNKYFSSLLEEHKEFHHTLGDIVGRFQAGEPIDIEKELSIGGTFDKVSLEVVKNVLLLQKVIEKEQTNKEAEI